MEAESCDLLHISCISKYSKTYFLDTKNQFNEFLNIKKMIALIF